MSFQVLEKNAIVFVSGGMSTEVNFAKYCAFRQNKVYGGWDNSIRTVYPSIIRDTLFSVVEHVKRLESEGCGKTVLHSPGFLSVAYMTELCNFVYLPSQFLVGFNSVAALQQVLADLKSHGIKAYAVAGYDNCIPECLVAWIKFVEMPKLYVELIENYLQSERVVLAGVYSEDSQTLGENAIYQYGQPTREICEGNLYFLHIHTCYGGSMQKDWDIFKEKAPDYDSQLLCQEPRVPYVGDWEAAFDILRSEYFPTFSGKLNLVKARDTKPLYHISYELSRKFMEINRIPIQGVVLNPYIMNTPTYETHYGYLGYSYWGGNPELENELSQTIPKDMPQDGTLWFNDQNSLCQRVFEKANLPRKVYIDNSNSMCHELTAWVFKHKPKVYPRRDFVSFRQLVKVLETCRVAVLPPTAPRRYIFYLHPAQGSPLHDHMETFWSESHQLCGQLGQQNHALRYPFHVTLTNFFQLDESKEQALVDIAKKSLAEVSPCPVVKSRLYKRQGFAGLSLEAPTVSEGIRRLLQDGQAFGLKSSTVDSLHMTLYNNVSAEMVALLDPKVEAIHPIPWSDTCIRLWKVEQDVSASPIWKHIHTFYQDAEYETLSTELTRLNPSLSSGQREPAETLFKMVGLRKVKEKAFDLYKMMKLGDIASSFKPALNFCFVGNPGTGKTETAQLFAKILHQTGARKDDRFVSVTATKALQMGEDKFEEMLTSLVGEADELVPCADRLELMVGTKVEVKDTLNGKWYAAKVKNRNPGFDATYDVEYLDKKKEEDVPRERIRVPKPKGCGLFVDEAYDLDPNSNYTGKAILAHIMQAAEEHRDSLTVILAGYKGDIQEKLFAFNQGMASRFEMVEFEDFLEPELRRLWYSFSKAKGVFSSAMTATVVARRLARMRNVKGFGNARQVRQLLERAVFRAMRGSPGQKIELRVEHIVGEPPDANPRLAEYMNELESMTGLHAVKKKIKAMVNTATQNYRRELMGQPIDLVTLNRLFVGSPGTGKTTVAHLYARILKELNLLTSGEVVSKVASDFKGSYVGVAEQKTRAILEEAEGKVLLIDEAYSLNDSTFGSKVLDTIVEKVSGKPGENIAVIMCGYPEQMFEMLREQNPGLARRFVKDDAFEFEDFNDEELKDIWLGLCQDVTVSDDVTSAVIKKLAQQRDCGQFGNAGDVNTLFAQAKVRMLERTQGRSRKLQLADVLSDSTLQRMQNPLQPLEELEDSAVKDQLVKLFARVKAYQRRGTDIRQLVKNFVFVGNAGVGKTITARLLGDIFQGLGLLGSSKVIETSANDLIGQYVGSTKQMMKSKMEEAAGGVLFIDEAYSLGVGSYGTEAIEQLIYMLTLPKYSGKTVVVLAGYETEMERMMITNQGLRSRFQEHIRFEDWDASKCLSLVEKKVEEDGFCVDESAKAVLLQGFQELSSRPGWANGRDAVSLARKLVDTLCETPSDRIQDTITETIAQAALKAMLEQRPPMNPEAAQRAVPEGPPMMHRPPNQLAPNAPAVNVDVNLQRRPPPPPRIELLEDPEELADEEVEEEVEDEEVEEEEHPYTKGAGLLNSALVQLGYDQNQGKVDALEQGTDAPLLAQVEALLRQMGCNDTKRILAEWKKALADARRHKDREMTRAQEQNLVPMFRCAVCGRTSTTWVPCPVAPYLWKLVDPKTLRAP